MTKPLAPPPRKDPQARTPTALIPPVARSRAALEMAAAAARGAFCLQTCSGCGHVLYPPRDACPRCLGTGLAWKPVPGTGELIALSTLHATTEPYFRDRLPWRVGTVRLEAGPMVTAHLHGDIPGPGPVRVAAKLDKSGNAVLMALPVEETPHMTDDPLWRELTASPRHRRVLVTDARSALGQGIVRAMRGAGAAHVFAGVATPWLPFDGAEALEADGVEQVDLDLTDPVSVTRAAGSIGGKTDIIVNTASHVRPGGVLAHKGLAMTHDIFEREVFGLQRLAQAFGPGMIGRGADGTNAAVALVDVLSVYGLANWGAHGVHSAAAAARHSLLTALRGEMRAGGVRVMAVYRGPVDDDWHQPLPPPKLAPDAIARAVMRALDEGIEESFVGDIAHDIAARLAQNPKALERELQV